MAASGAIARARNIEVVANNVANASTPGFRKMQSGFEEVMQSVQAPNRHHVALTEPRLSTALGALEETGNPRDLALTGPGYFVAEDGDDEVLLRTVSFRVTEDGKMVDGRGRELRAELSGDLDGRTPIEVDSHGVIRQADEVMGRLEVRGLFEDEAALTPVGGGAYRATDRSGPGIPLETSDVVAGAIERSNVTPVESMVELIQLERDFQSLTKVIQSYREADEGLIGAVSRG